MMEGTKESGNMKIVAPKSIHLQGDERGVLLLHSFTSTTRDMKKLAESLHADGYSCYVPSYHGHGLPVEELLATSPSDWWADVVKGYETLKEHGATSIAVIGVSLGGVFALKLAELYDVEKVVIMSVPYARSADDLFERVLAYGLNYKKLVRTERDDLERELGELLEADRTPLQQFSALIDNVMRDLASVTAPIHILYGQRDEPLYEKSAIRIAEALQSSDKLVKGYANSSHLMPLSRDKEEITAHIKEFLHIRSVDEPAFTK